MTRGENFDSGTVPRKKIPRPIPQPANRTPSRTVDRKPHSIPSRGVFSQLLSCETKPTKMVHVVYSTINFNLLLN